MSQDEKREAQELHRHRRDKGEWADKPEEIQARPTGSEVLSFRLPAEMLDDLEDAASRTGESLSEFLRSALALRLYGAPIGPAVELFTGGMSFTVRSHIAVDSWSENPSIVPDFPPMKVAN